MSPYLTNERGIVITHNQPKEEQKPSRRQRRYLINKIKRKMKRKI